MMPPYLHDYLIVFLFLIASGASLQLVAREQESRTHRFRILVMVLYGMTGIAALLLLFPGVNG